MMRKIATIAIVDTEVKRAVMTMKNTVLLPPLLSLSIVGLRVSFEREEASYEARGSMKHKTYANTMMGAE